MERETAHSVDSTLTSVTAVHRGAAVTHTCFRGTGAYRGVFLALTAFTLNQLELRAHTSSPLF
eukprot:2255419-Prymnesium_polylepis.1